MIYRPPTTKIAPIATNSVADRKLNVSRGNARGKSVAGTDFVTSLSRLF